MLFGSLAFSLLAALTSDAPARGEATPPARVAPSTNRNQDSGNQDQHQAQDYEVRYEAKKTGKSKAKVKRAVKKAGPSRKRVERAL